MAEINVPRYHTEIQTEFRSPARICIFTVKGMATNGHGRLHRMKDCNVTEPPVFQLGLF